MAEKYRIESVRYSNVDMDEIYDGERIVATVADGWGLSMVTLIEGETAPLHAEIERLKAQLKASNDALELTRSFVFDLAEFHSQDASKSKGFERNDLLGWVNAAKNLAGFLKRAVENAKESEGE